MKKQVQVHLAQSNEGPVSTVEIGRFETKTAAFKAAKLAAGRGSKFFSKGVDVGYAGANGLAYVRE
jgi:hypothetical protein